jgi:hypothetical protein
VAHYIPPHEEFNAHFLGSIHKIFSLHYFSLAGGVRRKYLGIPEFGDLVECQ